MMDISFCLPEFPSSLWWFFVFADTDYNEKKKKNWLTCPQC